MPPIMPRPTPETAPYWEGLKRGVVLLCHCHSCDRPYFPPSPVCPRCSGKAVSWEPVSGRATLFSYVVNERPAPEWGVEGPMSVAHVVLEEGPALVSTIVDCPQTEAALRLDMALEATFRPLGEGADAMTMLCFRPAEGERS